MKNFRRIGIENVSILGAGDSCEHCMKFAGEAFSIDSAPDLPHAECSHPMGCRCIANSSLEGLFSD